MNTTQYLIIGAGHAGAVAAFAARKQDSDGRIVMIGQETELPYERPGLSKAFLAGSKPLSAFNICDDKKLADNRIELKSGVTAESLFPNEKRVALSDGTQWEYEHLLLATGSRARVLDLPGADLAGVHYLRTDTDANSLRETLADTKHLVVIGAGFIGLEVAATACEAFGCSVTVIEAGPEVLQRAAPERLRGAIRKLHEKHGVKFLLKSGVERFLRSNGKVSGVQLADGETLTADAALVCVGAIPNIEIAARAKLETGQGILADGFGQTSNPNIWAAGEVAQHVLGSSRQFVRYESWQMAQTQAATVGANMAGAREAIAYVPWFWTDQYGHNFQMLGRMDADLNVAVRVYDDGLASTTLYMEGTKIVGALCIDSGPDIAPIRKAISLGLSGQIARLSDTNVKLKSTLKPS